MQKLSVKKKRQAVNFFNNPLKAAKLYRQIQIKAKKDSSIVLGKDRNAYPVIFKARIGNRDRAIKFSSDQNVAQFILDSIKLAHSRAIKKGVIAPKKYVLKIIYFLATGSEMGAMPIVKAPTYGELRSFLMYREDIQSPKAESFFAKHPWITKSSLNEAYVELKRNLNRLYELQKIPSFDLVSEGNVFILNADNKSKKIVFGLIDQVHPHDEKALEKKYYSLK